MKKYVIVLALSVMVFLGMCAVQPEQEDDDPCISIDEAIENFKQVLAEEQRIPLEEIEVVFTFDFGCDDYECRYFVVYQWPYGGELEMLFYHPIDDSCFWYY
jgi:hypothetical protein